MWCNSAFEHAGALILVSNPMFLGMGNHLRQFSGASDQSEGQKQGGGATINGREPKFVHSSILKGQSELI